MEKLNRIASKLMPFLLIVFLLTIPSLASAKIDSPTDGQTVSGIVPVTISYMGREYDKETGLYYYCAGYYDPVMGRFLTQDPIGYAGGINLYAYVKNNPINFFDPFGEPSVEKQRQFCLE